METLNNIKPKEVKRLLIFFLFLLWTFYSWTACGQVYKTKTIYKAMDASFGMRSFHLQSNIEVLNNMPVVEEGGQLGILFGNDILRTKVGVAGFFYSNGNVPRTVDMFESDLTFHLYPFGAKKSFVQPYLAGGLVYDKLKFSGYYLSGDKATINYSTSKEPVLGSIHQIRAAGGMGVEFRVMENDFEFFHIFAEAKISSGIAQKATSAFATTRSSNVMLISIGFRFGAKS